MPRLLLVDDNPSIHKIAETLLAPTSIELVCVESAADALKRIEAGQSFDVALVDIAMAGMDGWELLACLRAHPATVAMPIAMMAGVLDSVDPLRLEQAPIQGFLKKPVELRDLGDRVKKLLETPVPLPPPPPVVEVPVPAPAPNPEPHSAFATMPATKLSDLPEFRAAARLEDDLLELGEEDLLPESDSPSSLGADLFEGGAVEIAELNPEEPLDLEEFDLDGLKGLTLEAPSEGVPDGEPTLESPLDFPEPQVTGQLPVGFAEAASDLPPFEDLPDLGPSLDLDPMPNPEEASPAMSLVPAPEAPIDLPENVLDFDWVDDSEVLLKSDAAPELEMEAQPFPLPEMPSREMPIEHLAPETVVAPPEAISLAPVAASLPVVPLTPLTEVTSVPGCVTPDAKALVEAFKADPEALQALAKAVVAQLGDQALKDIAWELMPDLADRLGRH